MICADETVVQVLKEPGKKAQSESRMWVYCNGDSSLPPVALFEYQSGRSGRHPRSFLKGYAGYLLTDGYAGYNSVENVIHCGCWAHMRRKFEEMASKTIEGTNAAEGLGYCNELFRIERELSELPATQRHEERQKQSKPVLDAYFAWIESIHPLEQSGLGKAITYAKNQRKQLSAFLLDGRIEISNNRTENTIRPFVIGRKNWIFSDTVRGAEGSAIIYSIVLTALANNLNIFEYLSYLFTQLPKALRSNPKQSITEYLPWSKTLPEQCRAKNESTNDEN